MSINQKIFFLLDKTILSDYNYTERELEYFPPVLTVILTGDANDF